MTNDINKRTLLKEYKRKFSRYVNTAVSIEIKKVVYQAIAEVIISGFRGDLESIVTSKLLESIVDEIGEMAIIDKPLLLGILTKLAKFSLGYNKNKKDMVEIFSYLEYKGIYDYLTKEEIESIDKNFELFKDVFSTFSLVYTLYTEKEELLNEQ